MFSFVFGCIFLLIICLDQTCATGRSHLLTSSSTSSPSSSAPSAFNAANHQQFGNISPVVLQKYSLTPASSVVGTNVAPTEQLFSYVPSPQVITSDSSIHSTQIDPATAASLSPLPIMTAFKTLSNPSLMAAQAVPISLNAALASDIPVTYK